VVRRLGFASGKGYRGSAPIGSGFSLAITAEYFNGLTGMPRGMEDSSRNFSYFLFCG